MTTQTQTQREPEVGTKEAFELALTELYVYYSRNRSEERADKLLEAIRAYVTMREGSDREV